MTTVPERELRSRLAVIGTECCEKSWHLIEQHCLVTARMLARWAFGLAHEMPMSSWTLIPGNVFALECTLWGPLIHINAEIIDVNSKLYLGARYEMMSTRPTSRL